LFLAIQLLESKLHGCGGETFPTVKPSTVLQLVLATPEQHSTAPLPVGALIQICVNIIIFSAQHFAMNRDKSSKRYVSDQFCSRSIEVCLFTCGKVKIFTPTSDLSSDTGERRHKREEASKHTRTGGPLACGAGGQWPNKRLLDHQ